MSEYKNLPALGYRILTANGVVTGIVAPDGRFGGETIDANDAAGMNRLRHLSGRMGNIAYMAERMDQLDGAEKPTTRFGSDGARQFDHLLEAHPEKALAYLLLRRMQRSGDVRALHFGLRLLLSLEDGSIPADDAVVSIRTLSCADAPLPPEFAQRNASSRPNQPSITA